MNNNRIVLKALLTVCFLLLDGYLLQAQDHSMTIMTWNIRYSNLHDGDDRWDVRKEGVIRIIDSIKPEFLGVQEALPAQMAYLQSQLPQYMHIGIGREQGGKGEFTAIFYDTNSYQLDRATTFWLSPTPEVVSTGWDAALPRICTYGSFISLSDGSIMYVLNAHFDHVGELARNASAELIMDTISSITTKYPDAKIVLMGDFNAEFSSVAIQKMVKKLDWDGKDLKEPSGTFNGFDVQTIPTKRIDYIFTKNLKVLDYSHLNNKLQNNHYPSDHLPVIIKVTR